MGDGGPGGGRRRRGRRNDAGPRQDMDNFGIYSLGGDGFGKGGMKGGGSFGGKSGKEVVHHHPPKEMAADVGYPVRGGQTLLIAYFPWEASEADIEREFSKFCRVKRVHLVVDKSSRKPRCFGFVKFISKVDAEEALRATSQGLVQLPDTRGHVWHLKAEWTKSGDMVVDDSETEQEVAKRKEERKSRTEPGRPIGNGPPDAAVRGGGKNGGKWPAPLPPKGVLHPGVPAPLPPLQQPRGYTPAMQPPMGVQGQMPVMQHSHLMGPHGLPPPGVAPHPAPLGPGPGQPQQMPPPLQQPLHQQPPGVTQQAVYGSPSQQSLPIYSSGYPSAPAAPPVYGNLAPNMAQQGIPPRDAVQGGTAPTVGASPQSQAAGTMPVDAPAVAGAGSGQHLRDLVGTAGGYGAPHQAYATPGYPPQPGYPPPPAGYQGYAPGGPPYAAAPAPAPPYPGQQAPAYATSQQAYAAPGQYGSPPASYPPQPQASPYQQGIPSQPGYAQPPPSYASQAQAYPPQQLAPQPPGYASAPPPPYANYGMGQPGVVQPGAPPLPPPGPYGYAPPPPGVITDGAYPAHMPPATGLQPHPAAAVAGHHAAPGAPLLDEVLPGRQPMPHGYPLPSAEAAVAAHQAALAASAATAQEAAVAEASAPNSAIYHERMDVVSAVQQQDVSGMVSQSPVTAQVVLLPNTQSMQQPQMPQPVPQAVPEAMTQPDPGEVAVAAAHVTAIATAGPPAQSPQGPPAGADAQYLDMVWHLPEMSLHEKNPEALPAPPAQQPPAPPPAVHQAAGQWEAQAFREAASAGATAQAGPQGPGDWNVPAPRAALAAGPGGPGGRGAQAMAGHGSGPAALWNSFDEAAKGMVDGLVGEDGLSLPTGLVNT
mmetsp:Transcript_133564/g.249788  ORF Transcript_133564/g.249788 Transcript_133564/m.249788 type:complete len:873 (+) Transcript_133564:180-2798(+)